MIKAAVISDIHSNHVALQRCLDHAREQGAEYFLFLGDYVSDCPYPQATMEILYELAGREQCFFVRGNREEYLLGYHKGTKKNWKYVSGSGSLLYTLENLTDRDLVFFDEMTASKKITLGDCPPLTICHGSPADSRELLYANRENTREILERLDTEVLLCGHSHIQYAWEYQGKQIINPGSVGVPERYEGRMQYAMLTGTKERWDVTFYQMEYDLERVMQEFVESGLNEKAPYWARMTREMMRTGVNKMAPVVDRVAEICKGQYEWPDYPDVYWEQALMEIWPEIKER